VTTVTMIRPQYEGYALPSAERQQAPPPPAPLPVSLISDQLKPFQNLLITKRLYRICSEEHAALKRALLSSVRIRTRLTRG
jgi:hypothetical protein